ncbi:MAG: YibE/F family protein [Tissierellaceae bacterium]|nr:YibE/F family protein [Tissierellaceae bacterium]
MKRLAILVVVLVLSLTSTGFADDEYYDPIMVKAVVLEAGEAVTEEGMYEGIKVQHVKVKITSGIYKGMVLDLDNHMSDNIVYDIVVKEKDKVIVVIDDEDNLSDAYISDFQRSNYIFYLVGIFVILILAIGKIKGLKSVISLGLTVASVFYILLPMLLKGANPIPVSIAIAIGVTVVTILLVSGVNYKSVAAILGTSSGVLVAGIISYYIGSKAHLTGLNSEEASMLMYIPQNITFNFRNLLFAGIILGALGAVMDVGMSIASAIDEIHNANNKLTTKDLFKSGMNVGKDIMGTMTNTLILAYTGSSIPLLLLFSAYEASLIKVLNLDIIATEAVRSLAGSIGLVLTIPITALISSIMTKKQKQS